MIDHLLTFTSEAAAKAAIPQYWYPETEDGPGEWDGSACIPGVSVYAVTGMETVPASGEDPEYEREIRQYYPGWHIWVTMNEPNGLIELPDNACRIVADYEMWAQVADGWTWEEGDRSWMVYVAPGLTEEVMRAAHIVPTFGREKSYPFGIEA